MTKSKLINLLASRFSQGKRIEIRGFGSFSLNYRPPRLGRNPKTGSKVEVPEKYVPHFKAGKELRDRVDK
jgi:integration host factor subunit beta